MDTYSIIALVVRLILVLLLWKKAKGVLNPRTRSRTSLLEVVCAVSLLFGFYVYLFTLMLLVHLGIQMYTQWKRKEKLGKEALLFLLVSLIFLKGPGDFSLDNVLGNI